MGWKGKITSVEIARLYGIYATDYVRSFNLAKLLWWRTVNWNDSHNGARTVNWNDSHNDTRAVNWNDSHNDTTSNLTLKPWRLGVPLAKQSDKVENSMGKLGLPTDVHSGRFFNQNKYQLWVEYVSQLTIDTYFKHVGYGSENIWKTSCPSKI